MKSIRISTRQNADLPNTTLLELAGTLDESTLAEFESYWRTIDHQAQERVRLDFSQVSHISAFGLGFVVGILRELGEQHAVQLVNMPVSLQKLFEHASPSLRALVFGGNEAAGSQNAQTASALHHFTLLNQTGEVPSGLPFRLRVEARDREERCLKDFSGVVHLSADRGMLAPTLLNGFSQGAWEEDVIVTGQDQVELRAWNEHAEGRIRLRVVEQGEQVEFPITVVCPGCHKDTIAGKSDMMRCLRCNQIYFVDVRGHVVPLKSGNPLQAGFVKQIEFRIPSDINYLNHVRNFIVGISREENIGEEKVAQIEMSLDEALANVVEHAYSFDSFQEIHVTISLHTDRLVVSIRDHGRSFDEKHMPLPNIHEHIQQRRVGGLGRYLMKTLMDEVEYISDAYTNELRMMKRF